MKFFIMSAQMRLKEKQLDHFESPVQLESEVSGAHASLKDSFWVKRWLKDK